MTDRLPTTKALGDTVPRCPWCNGWLEDGHVRIADVFDSIALCEKAAQLFALPMDCPDCGKPVAIDAKFTHNTGRSWAVGARTAADKKLLGEPQ